LEQRLRSTLVAATAALPILICCTEAFAYRPFDSTDADVAEEKEFELELGPVGRRREGQQQIRIAPAVIANIGMAGDRELVIQGQREVAFDRSPGQPGAALVDNGVFIKQVLRRGALQDESGPSVATEAGFLLPPSRGPGRTGFSVAAIVSERWDSATLHVNAALAQTREHETDLFLGAIIEGPYTWTVRPVAEVFTEQTHGAPRTRSGLVGAIWRARDGLSFDVGLRSGSFGNEPIREIRLGLTWAFSFQKGP
jgi:hypothetical protein